MLTTFLEFARARHVTLSVAALILEAERRSIPWAGSTQPDLIQFGHGRCQKLVYGTITSNTSRAAIALATDKGRANRVLAARCLGSELLVTLKMLCGPQKVSAILW